MKNILILTFILSCVLIRHTNSQVSFYKQYTNAANQQKAVSEDNNGLVVTLTNGQWVILDEIDFTDDETTVVYTTLNTTLTGTGYVSVGVQQTPDNQKCIFPDGYYDGVDSLSIATLKGDAPIYCLTDHFSIYSGTIPTGSKSSGTQALATSTYYQWNFGGAAESGNVQAMSVKAVTVSSTGITTGTSNSNAYYTPDTPVSLGFETTYTGPIQICVQTADQFTLAPGACHIPCVTRDATSKKCTGCFNPTVYSLSTSTTATPMCGTVFGCDHYDGSDTDDLDAECAKCKSNTFLSGDGVACGPVPQCHTYSTIDPANLICTACEDGYYLANQASSANVLSTSGSTVTGALTQLTTCIPIKNCTNFNVQSAAGAAVTTGSCEACATGFILSVDKNYCGTVTSCNIYSADGQCKECDATSANIYLSGDRKTCGTIQNCQTYSSATTCSHCTMTSKTYLASDFKSCNPINNCKTYSSTTGLCTACDNSLILSGDGKYCGGVTGCQTYSDLGVCTGCTSTTQFLSGDAQTCGNAPNCQTYKSGVCSTCTSSSQTYKSGDNYCIAVANCASTLSTDHTQCSTCNNPTQYTLSGDKKTCGNVANCATYSSSGVCTACTGTLILSGDALTCGSIANCQEYSGTKCISCTPESQLFPNHAQTACIQNDVASDSGLSTVSCDNGLHPTSDYTFCGPVKNCDKYSNGLTCLECQAGTFLSGDSDSDYTCGPIDGCYDYNAAGDCQECKKGLYGNDNTAPYAFTACGIVENCGTYTDDTYQECTTCLTGFFSSTDKTVCGPINNCDKYVGDLCDSCAAGFIVSDDQKFCGKVEDCAEYGPGNVATKCVTCRPLFQITGDYQCNPVAYCSAEVASNGDCNACSKDGSGKTLYLSGDLLTCGLVEYCQTYSPNRQNCLQCQTGHTLSGDQKYCGSVEFCETYDATGNCISCTVSSGTWINTEQNYCGSVLNCVEYDGDSCIGCQNDLIPSLDGLTCGDVEFCNSYLADDCVSCREDLFLSGDDKTCGAVDNCQEYSVGLNGNCLSCTLSSQFILSGDYKYCGDTADCYSYDDDGVCTSCTDTSENPFLSGDSTTCGPVEDCENYSSFGICQGCTKVSETILAGDNNTCGYVEGCFSYKDDACVQCNADLFLAGNGLHCGPVEDCYSYSESGVCQSCTPSSGTYLSGDANTCGDVENCDEYDDDVCQSCTDESGTFISGDANTCGVVENCQSYVNDECQLCVGVYLLTSDRDFCTIPAEPAKKHLTAGEKAAICILTIAAGLAIIGTLAFVFKFKQQHLKVKSPKKRAGGDSNVQTAQHQQIVSPTTPASN